MIDSSHSLFLALEKQKHEPDCTAFSWRHSSGKHSICQNASAKVARGMMGARKPRAKFELRDGKLRYSLNFQLLLGYNFFFPSIFFSLPSFPPVFFTFVFETSSHVAERTLNPSWPSSMLGFRACTTIHVWLESSFILYTFYLLNMPLDTGQIMIVFSVGKKSFCQSVIWKKLIA